MKNSKQDQEQKNVNGGTCTRSWAQRKYRGSGPWGGIIGIELFLSRMSSSNREDTASLYIQCIPDTRKKQALGL